MKLGFININFYIILFIYFSSLKYIYGQGPGNNKINPNENKDEELYDIFPCELDSSINNQKCFNNVLRFNQKKYQLNNIALNKNGDFLI